jgi:hypothetical protein
MNGPAFPLVIGYAGPVLLASALLLRLLRNAALPLRLAAPAACAAALCVPLGNLSAAEYVRGAVGDLSAATFLLLAASAWQHLAGRPVLRRGDLAAVFACTTIGGLVLYPMTLGVGPVDPYAWGYRPLGLLAVLLALALLARWRHSLAAALIPWVVLAWCGGLLESTNLWDYLLDPFLAMYGLAWLAKTLIQRLFARRPAAACQEGPLRPGPETRAKSARA